MSLPSENQSMWYTTDGIKDKETRDDLNRCTKNIWENPTPFCHKITQQNRNRMELLKPNEDIYEKFTANNILNVKDWRLSP